MAASQTGKALGIGEGENILKVVSLFSHVGAALLLVAMCLGTANAQDQDTVLATVGEAQIMESRIDRYVTQKLGDRVVSDDQSSVLRKEALSHFVNRELVNHFLELRNYEVGESQIQLKLEILVANLDRVGQTLDDFLAKQNQSKESLEREIAWKIRWEKYLEKTLTDEVLENYFKTRRRKFDGTEVRVAQVLFRVLDTPASLEAALELAAAKKSEVESGKSTWKTVVETNSIAASREQEGVVGWIRIAEPMPREFSEVAFGLKPGELSDPFASKFGVHVLKCLEVKPGVANFGDVREDVKTSATKELFERIAARHQSEVAVEYAEGWGNNSSDNAP